MTDTNRRFEPAGDRLYEAMGIGLVERSTGRASLSVGGQVEWTGEQATAVAAFLVDAAVFQAVASVLDVDEDPGGTAELGITFFAVPAPGPLLAEAEVVAKSQPNVVVEVNLRDGRGTLFGRARATQLIRTAAPGRRV